MSSLWKLAQEILSLSGLKPKSQLMPITFFSQYRLPLEGLIPPNASMHLVEHTKVSPFSKLPSAVLLFMVWFSAVKVVEAVVLVMFSLLFWYEARNHVTHAVVVVRIMINAISINIFLVRKRAGLFL